MIENSSRPSWVPTPRRIDRWRFLLACVLSLCLWGCAQPIERSEYCFAIGDEHVTPAQREFLLNILREDKPCRIVEVTAGVYWERCQVYDHWVEDGTIRCEERELSGRRQDDATRRSLYSCRSPDLIQRYLELRDLIAILPASPTPPLETTTNPRLSWVILPESGKSLPFSARYFYQGLRVHDDVAAEDFYLNALRVPVSGGAIAHYMLDVFDAVAIEYQERSLED
jgi:hypothetical protein